jgi:hypothetical protein
MPWASSTPQRTLASALDVDDEIYTFLPMATSAEVQSSVVKLKAMGAQAGFGIIEARRIADLLVLTEDPRADIRAFRSITHVMRGGRLHRQSDLTQR